VTKSLNIYLISIITTFFLFAIWIYLKLDLSGDVYYLSYAAGQVLLGKKYGVDIFETNPPMILYLYMPVLFFAKKTGFSLLASFIVYIFSLSLYSILFSWILLKKIISNKNVLYFFICIVAFVVILLPLHAFGQREHVFFMLSLPYFFLAVARLDKIKISACLACVIGLLAGLGFCIKPFFLFPLIFIELYLLIKNRSLASVIRTEAVIIYAVITSYLATTIYFFPKYFTVLLPLINEFYFIGVKNSVVEIFTNSIVIFCAIAIAVGFFSLKQKQNKSIKLIMLLASLGAVAASLVTQTVWYYHMLPALSLAFLLLSFCCFELVVKYPYNDLNYYESFVYYLFSVLLCLILFAFPIREFFYVIEYAVTKNELKSGESYLVDYFSSQPKKSSVMCFSIVITDCFPLYSKLNMNYGSRYPFFWWLRGVLLVEKEKNIDQKKFLEGRKYLIDVVSDDLTKNKVDWVIIDNYHFHNFDKNFNYIKYFSENKKFSAAWSKYKFKKQIDDYAIYQRQE